MHSNECWLRARRLAVAAVCAALASCAQTPPEPEPAPAPEPGVSEIKEQLAETRLRRRADEERVQALAREVERLKADLVRAEDALVAVESRLQNSYSRANAVSSLAETQMQLNKASQAAPWRPAMIDQARDKLAIAQKHIDDQYFGAAMFFVYRVNRIMEELNYEANMVDETSSAMFINKPRVNLRAGPSTDNEVLITLEEGTPVVRENQQEDWVLVRTLTGFVGWIHISLLTGKEQYES